MRVWVVSVRRVSVLTVVILSLAAARSVVADCSVSVAIEPTDDAFARANDPGINYGAAGALTVSGADATNLFNEANGRYDSVIKINPAAALNAFNIAFGAGNWTLTSVELIANEVAAPQNGMFNVGVGQFSVNWLSNDDWVQGQGSPQFPIVAADNVMCWDLLQTILATATEAPMGTFTNPGVNGLHNYALNLAPAFVADVMSGGPVSLHLAPATSTVGYTFNATNNGNIESHPRVVLTAKATGGDINCDTVRDLLDVNAFILAVLDPAAFETTYPGCNIAGADLNHDGNINGRDIPSLVCAIVP